MKDPDYAEAVALNALAFLLADDERLRRFLAITGIDGPDLRDHLHEPVFLAGVLDFVLADEPLLQAFAAEAQQPAPVIAKLRRVLPDATQV